MDKPTIRRIAKIVLPLIGTGLIVIGLAVAVELDETADALRNARTLPLAAAAVLSLFVNLGLSSWQWKIAHDACGWKTPPAESLMIKAALYPVRLVFPSKTGDLSRALYLVRKKNADTAPALGMTVGVMALNVSLLLVMAAAVAPFADISTAWRSALALAAVGVIALFIIAGRLKYVLPDEKWGRRFKGLAIITDLPGRSLIGLIALGFVVYGLEAVQFMLCMSAAGVELPPALAFTGAPVVLIASNVPVAFLGLGAREAVSAAVFAKVAPAPLLVAGAALFSVTDALLLALIGLAWLPGFVSGLGSGKQNGPPPSDLRDNMDA